MPALNSGSWFAAVHSLGASTAQQMKFRAKKSGLPSPLVPETQPRLRFSFLQSQEQNVFASSDIILQPLGGATYCRPRRLGPAGRPGNRRAGASSASLLGN